MSEVNKQYWAEYVNRKSAGYSKVAKFAVRQSGSGYGADQFTEATKALIKDKFGCESEFVGTGTAANLIGIGACVSPERPGVAITSLAHLGVFEYRGVERYFGAELLIPGNSLLTLDLEETRKLIKSKHGRVSAVSVTLANERGNVYPISYLKALRELCDEEDILLHGDFARGFVAACAMNLEMRQMLSYFNIASLGTMKLGGPCEILCWRNSDFSPKIRETRMSLGHDPNSTVANAILLRYILEHEIAENAAKSVKLAKILAQGIIGMDISLEWARETNQVFPRFTRKLSEMLKTKYMYYDDYGNRGDAKEVVARLITSPTTSAKSVNRLLQTIRDCQKRI